MILAGDVGGTKVHLALYNVEQGKLCSVRDEVFPAPAFKGLEDIVRRFLTPSDKVTAACFGVPGPVRDGRLKLTNLPWELDNRELSSALNIPQVWFLNDLEAFGYGVPELTADQLFTLHEGDGDVVGHRALIAAGTGLGEALLIWEGAKHVPIPSEGGHVDFAPRNATEMELLAYLIDKLKGRVSAERVISGIGLKNIYEFLRDVKKLPEPPSLKQRMSNEDPNAVIGELGESGENELCSRTLDLFLAAYGAEAGNLALKMLSAGGVYIGGGIAPKLLRSIQNGNFMQAFLDKGRMSGLLKKMRVSIILDSKCALIGAAAYAAARQN